MLKESAPDLPFWAVFVELGLENLEDFGLNYGEILKNRAGAKFRKSVHAWLECGVQVCTQSGEPPSTGGRGTVEALLYGRRMQHRASSGGCWEIINEYSGRLSGILCGDVLIKKEKRD